ncbi:UDP-N-acetylmuramate dehydrogenase [Bacillus fonticola]|uniref:UDP-N-acetylmuramate dehydrogenase n=1 Tax=Bacillus fonticola TaxID=2728853 RepID=UPI0014757853|nr:UDP-N-acetylmuramate dehydrogenase [Bacillus fonticola]
MTDWKDAIRSLQLTAVKWDEPMKSHTTMKVGGNADCFISIHSVQELQSALKVATEHHVPWQAIGRGSNLLVSDEGIEGIVFQLGKGMDHLDVTGEGLLTVGGGFSLVVLSTKMSRQGWSGLEFASGIPGSVGGAVYMNAGAHGSDMQAIVERVHVLFEDGTLEWVSNEEMAFSYRTSVLQNERPGIVVEAVLRVKAGEREQIVEQMQKNKEYRKETQPWSKPCAGSIFRNPLPLYAGKLVEEKGLKGYTIGGAQISDLHGNFIVNTGRANAKDVLALIAHVKQTMKESYDVSMETEVEWMGRPHSETKGKKL